MNTATIPLITEPLSPIPGSRVSGTLLAFFVIRLPVTGEFFQSLQAKLLGESKLIGETRKVPEHRDQGIGLNDSVKRGSLCLLILTRSTSPSLDQFPLRVCSCALCIINRL